MKKLILLTFALLSLSVFAEEKAIIFPMCRYSQSEAECRVWNTTGRQTSCNVHVRIRTTKQVYTDYRYAVLFQGQMAWFNYRANDPKNEPIIGADATAFCN